MHEGTLRHALVPALSPFLPLSKSMLGIVIGGLFLP